MVRDARDDSISPSPMSPPSRSETPSSVFLITEAHARHPHPDLSLRRQATRVRTFRPHHPSPAISHMLLADVLGTGDHEFACGLLAQFADVARSGIRLATIELFLSIVHGIDPKDETEALLAAQMAEIHNATMVAARRLKHVETIPQQDSASTMLNKLARTFAAQVEAPRNTAQPASKRSRCNMRLSTRAARPLSATLTRGVGTQQIMETNLMNPVQLLNAAPRCSATSKQSRHKCRAPAVRGWKVVDFTGRGAGHQRARLMAPGNMVALRTTQ